MAIYDPYKTLLTSEGELQYDLARLRAQDAAQRAAMRNQIAALQADYNGEGNPYSTVAQLKRQRDSARGNLRAQLAARGAIQSGEYALGEGEIGYDYGLQNYNAARGLSQQIAQLQSQYANDAYGRLGESEGLYGDALDRLRGSGFTPQKVSSPRRSIYGKDYGLGYYRDNQGRLTYKAPRRRGSGARVNPLIRTGSLERFRGGH